MLYNFPLCILGAPKSCIDFVANIDIASNQKSERHLAPQKRIKIHAHPIIGWRGVFTFIHKAHHGLKDPACTKGTF